jgi:hypothetical protein
MFLDYELTIHGNIKLSIGYMLSSSSEQLRYKITDIYRDESNGNKIMFEVTRHRVGIVSSINKKAYTRGELENYLYRRPTQVTGAYVIGSGNTISSGYSFRGTGTSNYTVNPGTGYVTSGGASAMYPSSTTIRLNRSSND